MSTRAVAVVRALVLGSVMVGCAPAAELPQCNCPTEAAFDAPGCAGVCTMVANNTPGPDGGQLVEWAMHGRCSTAEQVRGCHASPPTSYGAGPLAPPGLAT